METKYKKIITFNKKKYELYFIASNQSVKSQVIYLEVLYGTLTYFNNIKRLNYKSLEFYA